MTDSSNISRKEISGRGLVDGGERRSEGVLDSKTVAESPVGSALQTQALSPASQMPRTVSQGNADGDASASIGVAPSTRTGNGVSICEDVQMSTQQDSVTGPSEQSDKKTITGLRSGAISTESDFVLTQRAHAVSAMTGKQTSETNATGRSTVTVKTVRPRVKQCGWKKVETTSCEAHSLAEELKRPDATSSSAFDSGRTLVGRQREDTSETKPGSPDWRFFVPKPTPKRADGSRAGHSSGSSAHRRSKGQKEMKKAATKTKAAMEVVRNLAEQKDAELGNLDATEEIAADVVEDVKEELKSMEDAAIEHEIEEDYELKEYKKLQTVAARSPVESGIWGHIMSKDGQDSVFGEGISWTRRWIKIADLPEPAPGKMVRGTSDQSFTARTVHADLTHWRMVTHVRYAACPTELFKSFPNFQPVPGSEGVEQATYPFVKAWKTTTQDMTVSLRAVCNMKNNNTAKAITALDSISLSSLYRMRTPVINIPADDTKIMDGTIKFLYDLCLGMVQDANDEDGDPCSFHFGITTPVGPTPLHTDTVAARLTSRLCKWSDQVSGYMTAGLRLSLGFLVFLLAYMLVVPSFPALILMTLTLLLAESPSALLQRVPWLISLSYVIFELSSAGTFIATFVLLTWLPMYLFSRGCVVLLTRFGAVRKFLQIGEDVDAPLENLICSATHLLSSSLITMVECSSRRLEQSTRELTRLRLIAAQYSPQLSASCTRIRSSLSTSLLPSVGITLLPAVQPQATYFTPLTIRVLKLTSLLKSCESAKLRSIAICCAIFLVMTLSCAIWWLRSPPPTASASQISRSTYEVAECLATCAHRWAMGSPTSCSCSTPLNVLGRQSRGLLRATMDYLLPPS